MQLHSIIYESQYLPGIHIRFALIDYQLEAFPTNIHHGNMTSKGLLHKELELLTSALKKTHSIA